jgi:hypothetical protein
VVAPLVIALVIIASLHAPKQNSAVVAIGVAAIIVASIAFVYWLRSTYALDHRM